MKRFLAASLMLAFFVTAGTQPASARPLFVAFPKRPGTCPRTFTVAMAKRAARAVYGGTGTVREKQRLMLGRIVKCQRRPAAKPYVRGFIHRQRQAWLARRYAAAHPWHGPDIASWYYDAGSTACGFHATYGFASLFLPCGAQIQMRGPGGAVVTATMEDHGPYVAGRTFDLNPALKAALGCSDLCSVYWR